MLIVLGPDLQPRLRDEWEFTKFAIHVEGKVALDGLRAVGMLEESKAVWVRQAWLRENSRCWTDTAWQARFHAMLEAARVHGWVHAETGNIKAHIVRIERASPQTVARPAPEVLR